MDAVPTKVCNHCHEAKPLTEFGKRSQSPDGHEYRCKTCYNSAYFERTVEHKVCTQCGEDKPAAEFQRRSASKDGLQPKCKVCVLAYDAVDYSEKRDQHLANARAYEETHRETINAAHRNWHARNPAAQPALHRKKRYRLTSAQFERMWQQQGGLCAICDQPMDRSGPKGTQPHVDHDHSCCPSGTRGCGNCVRALLCQSCNLGMGFFSDNPKRMERAAAYVRFHAAPPLEAVE